MTTGDIDGYSPEALTAEARRQVEIAAQYPNGALRLGHPGIPAPRYEEDAIKHGLLDRVEVSDPDADPTLYLLIVTGAGKNILATRGDSKDRITVAGARLQVESAFGQPTQL